jgi:hypothetical protein
MTTTGRELEDTSPHVRRRILRGSEEKLFIMNAGPQTCKSPNQIAWELTTPTCYHHFARAEKGHLSRMSLHVVRATGLLNRAAFISQKHREHGVKENKRVCGSLGRRVFLRMLPLPCSLALALRIFWLL